jgi:hypothetical protein
MKQLKTGLPEILLSYRRGTEVKTRITSAKDAYLSLKELYEVETIDYIEYSTLTVLKPLDEFSCTKSIISRSRKVCLNAESITKLSIIDSYRYREVKLESISNHIIRKPSIFIIPCDSKFRWSSNRYFTLNLLF